MSLEEYHRVLKEVVEEVLGDMAPCSWIRLQSKMQRCMVVNEKNDPFHAKTAIYTEMMKTTKATSNPIFKTTYKKVDPKLFKSEDPANVVKRSQRKR